MRSGKGSMGQWGRRLLARTGHKGASLAVAAVARKPSVMVWYSLMGRSVPPEDIDGEVALKVGKMISSVGTQWIEELDKSRAEFRKQIFGSIKTQRVYVLEPDKKYDRAKCESEGWKGAVVGKWSFRKSYGAEYWVFGHGMGKVLED